MKQKSIARAELKVGQKVLAPSLFGYRRATVCFIAADRRAAAAKTAGLFFPLRLEEDKWWCDGSAMEKAVESLGKALK